MLLHATMSKISMPITNNIILLDLFKYFSLHHKILIVVYLPNLTLILEWMVFFCHLEISSVGKYPPPIATTFGSIFCPISTSKTHNDPTISKRIAYVQIEIYSSITLRALSLIF